MHRNLRLICPLMMVSLLSGCFGLGTERSEGRAAALMDAARPEAEAHAKALAGDDIRAARRSGVRLLAIHRQWGSDG